MEVPEIFVHTLTVYGRRVQEFSKNPEFRKL